VISGDIGRGVRFHEATGLEARDAEALARAVQLRVLRWFARRELLDPTTAADMRTWRGTGGFSVDGSVRIERHDRAGLERLVRYCARGPLALERLHAPAGITALSSPEARLVYRLPEPDVHGLHELRLTLHQTPEVASAVLAIFLRALRATLRETSPGAPVALRDAQLGAISFPQRFGSSLNPHYHYHVLGLDGVVSGDIERGVQFHEAIGLEAQDAEALARTVQLRVLRWFARRGLLDPSTAADMRTWQGSGGFSVDGSVRIEGEDRAGLERLVRYCARGPLALERLHAPAGIGALSSPDAPLVYRLPEPDVHGRLELRLTPLALLERLARLVPPPRLHRHRYHGVLAPNARLRSTVVSIGRPVPDGVPGDVGPP
jgi:hypothetical protein